jgi:hypothetical protein
MGWFIVYNKGQGGADMMTLQDVKNAVDQLNRDQLDELLAHIEKRRKEEWKQAFNAAVDEIREGLTDAQIKEMVDAMNQDYIEDVDLDQWRD